MQPSSFGTRGAKVVDLCRVHPSDARSQENPQHAPISARATSPGKSWCNLMLTKSADCIISAAYADAATVAARLDKALRGPALSR
jgi:hypothetical protein